MALLIEYFVCHDRSIKRDDLIDRRLTNHWSRSSFVRHFHLAGSQMKHSCIGGDIKPAHAKPRIP